MRSAPTAARIAISRVRRRVAWETELYRPVKTRRSPIPASDPAKVAAMCIGNSAPVAASVRGRTSTEAPNQHARAFRKGWAHWAPLAAVATSSCANEKGVKNTGGWYLAESAQLGICRYSDNFEETRFLAAYSDLFADRVGVTEETVRQGFVENGRYGVAGAIGDLEISTAQNGDVENPADLLAATEFVGLARGRKRVAGGAQNPAIAVHPSAAAFRST
jgi:hypothetical protein